MTMQVLDVVIYEREQYDLVGWNAGRIFDPAKFGIQTAPLNTGCLRGCHCFFKIDQETFLLDSMKIRSEDGNYFKINDVHPTPRGQIAGKGEVTYHGLNLNIPYTGTIRLGKDLTGPPHFSTFLPPDEWMYSKVIDVELSNGSVQSIKDMSAEMAERREKEGPPLTWMEDQRRKLDALRTAGQKENP